MDLPNFQTIKRLSLALQENCQLIKLRLETTDHKNFAFINERLTFSFLGEPIPEKRNLFENKFHPEADRIFKETTAQINLLCEILQIKKPHSLTDSQQWIEEVNNIALAGLAIASCEKNSQ
jgi:hypothetical protein